MHRKNLFHRFIKINALNSFVYDAMSNGKNCLIGIVFSQETNKLSGTPLHLIQSFYVVWKDFIFQVRNKATGKAAPVTFSKKRCRGHVLLMWHSDNTASVNGTLQIACHKSIYATRQHHITQLFSLLYTLFIQFTGCLSLQYLRFIGRGFPMPRQ